MVEPAQVAAFFDLDGTLYDGRIWQALVRVLRERRLNRRWIYFFLATHIGLWLLYTLRLMSRLAVYRTWTEHMAWMVRGVKVDEAPAIWDAIADEVLSALRPAVVGRLRDHQAQGHRPVLVSGSFRPISEAVAARLDIPDVLATALEVRDGRYTGRIARGPYVGERATGIVPPLCQGPGKRVHVEAFLADAGAGIDLAASYAYADSFVDEDLLSLVGHPVAVAPDSGLAAIAAERGWPVIAG